MPVLTAIVGDNSDLFLEASKIYLHRNDWVLDMTWGKGVFWKKIDQNQFNLIRNDLDPARGDEHYDFRNVPFASDAWSAVVLDPPYASRSSNKNSMVGNLYNNKYHNLKTVEDVLQFYYDGMLEAKRLLKPGGVLFIKCMDEVAGGKQHRNHITLWNRAVCDLGLVDEDLFLLVQKQTPVMRHTYQKHARKNNSYLWVFRKENKA